TGASRWFRWLRPSLDLLFWLTSALAVFHVVYRFDDGRVRLYVFVLLCAGYLVYRMTLHAAVVHSAFTVVRAIRAMALALWRLFRALVLTPVALCLRLVWRVLVLVYRVLCRAEDAVFWTLGLVARLTGLRRLWASSPVERFRRMAGERWEEFWTAVSKKIKSKCVRN
ncbi:spore cortex biosynthesis protein YabQ, partial [Alicyclobacillus sp.]|uniref:spore cortex biosynthesis protein YabQ n=1 Tax=Alicyclobacillus sp. TaxID=61169 RepID=UPI0025C1EDC4